MIAESPPRPAAKRRPRPAHARPPAGVAARPTDSPSVLYYSHDTYGLGHLSRTRALARELKLHRPDVSQLIVTGSPVAHDLLGGGGLDGVDFIKLPSVVKRGAEWYEARSMAVAFDAVRAMRGEILASAARHLRPDVFVVDHTPAGLAGEVLPALRDLRSKSPRTHLVLGLRDIVDEPSVVRRAWSAGGVHALLDDVYDTILVYGQPDVFDFVRAYGLSDRAAAKLRYVGYLGHRPGIATAEGTLWARHRGPSGLPDESRPDDRPARRRILVTAGGGGDGYPLFRTMLDGLRLRAPSDWAACLVPGPLMAESERAHLRSLAAGLPGVDLVDFTPDLGGAIASADAVVAMGGYNTVCEILAAGRPALIVPRVTPRREQILRARQLQRRGVVEVLHPQELTPDSLVNAIDGLLRTPHRPDAALRLDGLTVAAAAIAALLPAGAAAAEPDRLPKAG